MSTEDIRVLSDVSKYDEQTRQALATAINIAYAAKEKGVLPDEAQPMKAPCFSVETLQLEGFTPWQYDESKWELDGLVLGFDHTGMARVTKYRGRQIVATGGASTLAQLRNLIQTA